MVTYNRKILFNFVIIFIFVNILEANSFSDDEDMTTESFEDDWHMDFMPTGYLPDSVYRELAWYGILQIQPLHHSSKYKVAAQLIWQHTLGRPHVIMENPPQSTQSQGKISRQILAEDAAKWSREQRAAQEVLMENIKSGGNGLTVRTVISATTKTVYIIQNGNYYKCPPGTEPNLDEYRTQANMHERKCTYGKPSIQVPVDACIEAEIAPIEYSFHEGWMFCLGNGDRENNYFQNGTLDCGNKTKVSLDEFYDMCAIDHNVVITFEYFGDEPRKDMMHNATLCTTWDPCRLSYLYRLEPPPEDLTPAFPTASPNPCDTTVCPDCLEGATQDKGIEIELDSDDEEINDGESGEAKTKADAEDHTGGADDDGTTEANDANNANDASDAKDAADTTIADDADDSAATTDNTPNANGSKLKLGDACTDTAECSGIDGATCGAAKTCVCNKYSHKQDGDSCKPLAKSAEACAAKEDCVPGAECTNTKCECVAATHVAQVDNTCKLKAGSTEKCETKDDCTAGAKCDADKCVCETAEDTDKPGTCKASAADAAADANPGAIKLGATCTATAECSGIVGAICSGADAAKTCACNMYTHKEDGGSCKAYLTTGETCKPADTDCGPGGQCTEPAGTEVCSCKETHVAQAADKFCKIRPEQAAVPCTADEECTADATCDATAPRQCKCKAGKKADAATGTCIDE